MSIDKITARILQEAKSEADEMTQQAKQEAAAQMEAAKKQAEAIEREMAEKAVTDAAVLKERRASVAELEARKMQLAAKQEMIAKSFELALEELTKMPQETYRKFLMAHLAPYDRGEVLLNAADKERFGQAFADEIAAKGLTLAAETADISGGFILRTGKVAINASLETILETEKKQITAQIARTLFS